MKDVRGPMMAGVLENPPPIFFFIVSRPVAPTESDRVRVPAVPHGWM